MAMLYALLVNQWNSGLHECFIEGIDLGSMKLHTLISLGAGWPTAFAISGAQQRAYVADPGHSEVRVYDTAGPLVGKVALSSPPYDCALTEDGTRLIVSTHAGLALVDTTSLTATVAVQGPFPPSNVAYPQWLTTSAAIALSPDSNELAVVYGAIRPDSPNTPPASSLVNVSNLSTAKTFVGPPSQTGLWWPVYEVAYAGNTGSILFLAAAGAVVAMDPQTGKNVSWTNLSDASDPYLNSLSYSPAAGRAYVTSGLQTLTGKIFKPSLWIVDPTAATAQHVEGFTGAPYLASVEDASQMVYVAVRRRVTVQDYGIVPSLPDQLARYNAISASLEPNVYEFNSATLNVIAMQTTAESVFDPGVGEHAHAEQSVQILFGVIGGAGGWVITPHGIIKPVDPAPIQPAGLNLPDTLGRVLRAGKVARSAASIPDRALREQITNTALEYAQRLLAQVKNQR